LTGGKKLTADGHLDKRNLLSEETKASVEKPQKPQKNSPTRTAAGEKPNKNCHRQTA